MSDLKASISKSMWKIETMTVVPSRIGLVSRRISLIISNSLPSPPPGLEMPCAAFLAVCLAPSSTLAMMLNFQFAKLFKLMWRGSLVTVEFKVVM